MNQKEYDSWLSSFLHNPHEIPPEVLDYFSYDEHWDLRSCVATNQNTTPEILDRLANDEDWCVREGVASNPNTYSELLERMSYDKNDWVRYRVAHNPNTPQYIKDLYKFKYYLKYYV